MSNREIDAMVQERVFGSTLARGPVNAIHVEGEWSIYPANEDRARFGADSGWMCYSGQEPAYVRWPDRDEEPDPWEDGDERWKEEYRADKEHYGWSHHCLRVVPRYTEDIRAAMAAAEKAIERTGFRFQCGYGPNLSGEPRWYAFFGDPEDASATGDTLPRVIALAALRAVGVEAPC